MTLLGTAGTGDAVLVLVAGAMLAAGVATSVVAVRLRLPALVLFLGLGMLLGTDGIGGIDFADYSLARLIGSGALLLILYEGGLHLGIPRLRTVLGPAVSLAVVGTIGTALIAGLAARALFGFSTLESFLIGAILSGTDGAAVFALLRTAPLPTRLVRTLEGEAGLNDPVAVLLVLVSEDLLLKPSYHATDAALFLLQEVVVGLVVGIVMGRLGVVGLRRLAGQPASLSLVASASIAGISFGLAGALGGSGFLAVYLAGLAVHGADIEAMPAVRAFHEGLAAVAEIGLFLALGLLVFPSQLGSVLVEGTLLALVIAFVARPLATLAATALFSYTRAERLLIAWAGLRGAVPVVLATFPVIEHVDHSLEFFNIAFFAVLVSTLIQGTTVAPLARVLGIAAEPEPTPAYSPT
jgi:cell volume regulation protein A